MKGHDGVEPPSVPTLFVSLMSPFMTSPHPMIPGYIGYDWLSFPALYLNLVDPQDQHFLYRDLCSFRLPGTVELTVTNFSAHDVGQRFEPVIFRYFVVGSAVGNLHNRELRVASASAGA